MVQATTADAAQPRDHLNTKGDAEIIRQLQRALDYRRRLPAFARGQMIWDFDLGKVRVSA